MGTITEIGVECWHNPCSGEAKEKAGRASCPPWGQQVGELEEEGRWEGLRLIPDAAGPSKHEFETEPEMDFLSVSIICAPLKPDSSLVTVTKVLLVSSVYYQGISLHGVGGNDPVPGLGCLEPAVFVPPCLFFLSIVIC